MSKPLEASFLIPIKGKITLDDALKEFDRTLDEIAQDLDKKVKNGGSAATASYKYLRLLKCQDSLRQFQVFVKTKKISYEQKSLF